MLRSRPTFSVYPLSLPSQSTHSGALLFLSLAASLLAGLMLRRRLQRGKGGLSWASMIALEAEARDEAMSLPHA